MVDGVVGTPKSRQCKKKLGFNGFFRGFFGFLSGVFPPIYIQKNRLLSRYLTVYIPTYHMRKGARNGGGNIFSRGRLPAVGPGKWGGGSHGCSASQGFI